MDYKKDIELLQCACHSIESEWGYDTAEKFYDALGRVEKSLVLLEVLKDQAKHSRVYSESDIEEINRKFDRMEEEWWILDYFL